VGGWGEGSVGGVSTVSGLSAGARLQLANALRSLPEPEFAYDIRLANMYPIHPSVQPTTHLSICSSIYLSSVHRPAHAHNSPPPPSLPPSLPLTRPPSVPNPHSVPDPDAAGGSEKDSPETLARLGTAAVVSDAADEASAAQLAQLRATQRRAAERSAPVRLGLPLPASAPAPSLLAETRSNSNSNGSGSARARARAPAKEREAAAQLIDAEVAALVAFDCLHGTGTGYAPLLLFLFLFVSFFSFLT
jgi:hypothetical protein